MQNLEAREEIQNIVYELTEEASRCQSICIARNVWAWGNKENVKIRSQTKEREKSLTVGLLVL